MHEFALCKLCFLHVFFAFYAELIFCSTTTLQHHAMKLLFLRKLPPICLSSAGVKGLLEHCSEDVLNLPANDNFHPSKSKWKRIFRDFAPNTISPRSGKWESHEPLALGLLIIILVTICSTITSRP